MSDYSITDYNISAISDLSAINSLSGSDLLLVTRIENEEEVVPYSYKISFNDFGQNVGEIINSSYYKKGETSSSTQIEEEFGKYVQGHLGYESKSGQNKYAVEQDNDNKLYVHVDNVASLCGYSHIILSQSDYDYLSTEQKLDPNTIYLTSSDSNNSNTLQNGMMFASGLMSSQQNQNNMIYCIESWHDGTEWYRIYSDDWCEQGGVVDAQNVSSNRITLHKELEMGYSVNGMVYDDFRRNNLCRLSIKPKTTSQIQWKQQIGDSEVSSCQFSWEVKGWLK